MAVNRHYPQRPALSGPTDELPVDIAAMPPAYRPSGSGYGIGFFLKWGILFALLIFSVIVGLLISKSTNQLPDVSILKNYHPNESTEIFDRNGTLIANIHGDEDRVVVPLKDISPYMQRAVMAIEDNRFYEHNGVDLRGSLRALVTDLNADEHVQGGSTLTQQLVKNLFLTPQKSYTRKIAEAILAMRVEKHYSKDQILEMYLNQVYFGNLAYGIEKAARRYFHVPAKKLTVAQSALLAGLLKAPEGLSPYVYPQAAKKRQREVLAKMLEFGYISQAQYQTALDEPLVYNTQAAKPSKHPYFVAYVIQELENQFGDDVVRRGGLKVYTTMDNAAQDAAEKAIEAGVNDAPKGSGIKQGAMVAIDVQSGDVIAMVGGVDFKKNQFNAATQSRRAVGSTFKPFVYLTAFRLGKITTNTPISDRPVTYGNWSPHNWDGKYLGAMNIRKALTLSRNTTTVQVGMKVGIDEITKTCHEAGIRSPIMHDSSSLLGSSGVSPLELVTAYSTFARGGIYLQPTVISRVEDNQGNIVPSDSRQPRRVFNQNDVAALVDILVDVVEKGTGKNAILPDRVVAGKTGTTDQMRDIWFMGFTPDLVAGVWMGDPKNVPMHQVFGANAAKVWHDFAVAYYESHPIPPQQFFTADVEYATRMGLIHLVDKSATGTGAKTPRVQGIQSVDKPVTRVLKKKELKTDNSPPIPRAGILEPATDAPRNSRNSITKYPAAPVIMTDTAHTRPAATGNSQTAPPTPESPALRQQKFQGWKHTLDNVQDNLNNDAQ